MHFSADMVKVVTTVLDNSDLLAIIVMFLQRAIKGTMKAYMEENFLKQESLKEKVEEEEVSVILYVISKFKFIFLY